VGGGVASSSSSEAYDSLVETFTIYTNALLLAVLLVAYPLETVRCAGDEADHLGRAETR
jgi:hypothetical protein